MLFQMKEKDKFSGGIDTNFTKLFQRYPEANCSGMERKNDFTEKKIKSDEIKNTL